MNLNWKLYTILIIPALISLIIIGIFFRSHYFLIPAVVAVFWVLYYSINYIHKRMAKRN